MAIGPVYADLLVLLLLVYPVRVFWFIDWRNIAHVGKYEEVHVSVYLWKRHITFYF